MMKNTVLAFSFVIVLIQSLAGFADNTAQRALILVDIDGTLGVQAKAKPDFSDGTIAKIPGDTFGDFYYYAGALDFVKKLIAYKNEAALEGRLIDLGLFTMGSGPRNEIIRDFIETQLALKHESIAVYDYSHAVFSQTMVDMWRANDPALSSSTKAYFDSLEKPIQSAFLDGKKMYCKDLSKLLHYYPGLSLSRVTLIDDNELAVPDSQTSHLIVAKPENGYLEIVQQLDLFVKGLKRK